MAARLRPDALLRETVEGVKRCGSVSGYAKAAGLPVATVKDRIAGARQRWPDCLPMADRSGTWASPEQAAYTLELRAEIDTGHVVIFGDAHYGWSDRVGPAHYALLAVLEQIKPAIVIANGDVIDAAGASKHPAVGQQKRPRMDQEVIRAQQRLGEIAKAAGGAQLFRTVGNHDQRYDRQLSTMVPDFAALHGMRLSDHLPDWQEAWRVRINDDLMVLHRWHGGVHAAHNNVVKAGISIATNDTHALEAKPFTDYRGRRWSIQCGMLADRQDAAFEFMAGKPAQWCEGFAVISFADGQILTPTYCEVIDGTAWFRGEKVQYGRQRDPLPAQNPASDGGRSPKRNARR
jgi:hypothetical protein